MKKFIILTVSTCFLLLAWGCLTPPSFQGEYKDKGPRETSYKVTDYNDGFRVDMTYFKYEYEGTTSETTFEARHKLKQIALWIAEARKKKLQPIKIEDIESRHYYNSASRHTHWRGNIRVYYAD
jgi:hypothetical protein